MKIKWICLINLDEYENTTYKSNEYNIRGILIVRRKLVEPTMRQVNTNGPFAGMQFS